MGKLPLKSSGVTLLLLMVKEASYPLTIFPVTVPLDLLVTAILNVRKSLLATTKSN